MYDHLELLFPARIIPALGNLRGEAWQALVAEVRARPATSVEHLGFVLLITRLARCGTCSIDSQRAVRGCAACTRKAVVRFKGSDEDLIAQYRQACDEVAQFLATGRAQASAGSSPETSIAARKPHPQSRV